MRGAFNGVSLSPLHGMWPRSNFEQIQYVIVIIKHQSLSSDIVSHEPYHNQQTDRSLTFACESKNSHSRKWMEKHRAIVLAF